MNSRWFALTLLFALVSCNRDSTDDADGRSGDETQDVRLNAIAVELVDDLPDCTSAAVGRIIYVSSEDKIYYCDETAEWFLAPFQGEKGEDGAPGGGAGSSTTLDGPVFLATSDDIAGLADKTKINGSLYVTGNELTEVTLPASLDHIAGGLFFESTSVTKFHAPGLKKMGGGINGLLTSATGALGPPAKLTTIDLPVLTHIGGVIYLSGATKLTTVNMPMLHYVGGEIRMSSCPELVTLTLGELEYAQCIEIYASDKLVSVDLSLLKYINACVIIANNAELTTLNMDALTSVGGEFIISQNPKLATCTVLDILGNITPSPSGPDTGGNKDPNATCGG